MKKVIIQCQTGVYKIYLPEARGLHPPLRLDLAQFEETVSVACGRAQPHATLMLKQGSADPQNKFETLYQGL